MASVCLDDVSKVFPNGETAVCNLTLNVEDEELIVLVGPSGCGKSTTLRMIAGLESPTRGEIRIGGRVVNNTPPKDRDIAMVFQNYALYPHMSVYKNMAFGLQLRYGSNAIARIWRRLTKPALEAQMADQRKAIRGRVERTARTLGIEHLLDRMPRQLSGGERQRVALGRAIVRQPAAFLFDEPLSNLDAKLRMEMRRELNQLHRQLKATMIYVTHDQTEAMTLGDRVVVMKEGELQQIGTPLQVYDQPQNQFVAAFIGAPAMNFASGAITTPDGGEWFEGDGLTVNLAAARNQLAASGAEQPGRQVTLGVRPEDVHVHTTAAPTAETCGRGRVALIESLGDTTLIHLEVAAEPRITAAGAAGQPPTLTSKTHARTPVRVGDQLDISIDTARIHLFDPDTGKNFSR